MLADVVHRVPVFCEDQELPAAVLEFVKLGLGQTPAQRRQFGVGCLLPYPPCLLQQVVEGSDLPPELLQLQCRRVFVDQGVSFGVIKVVFVALGVVEAALDRGQPLRPLRGRQTLQLLQ